MLNMTVVCPRCGNEVHIAAEEFNPTMPIYDEQEMEANAICDCGTMSFNITILLEEDEEVDALHIADIKVTSVPVEN